MSPKPTAITLTVTVGVAARRHHDAERRARVPAGVGGDQSAGERRLAEVDQIALQPHQDRLGFRIAESTIELEHIGRAVRGDHQSRIEKSQVGVAVRAQSAQGRLDHFVHDARVQRGRDDGCGRVGAHAAGIGPAIAVVAALVVL